MEELILDINEETSTSTPTTKVDGRKEDHEKEINESSKSSETPRDEEKKTDYNEKSLVEPKFSDYTVRLPPSSSCGKH
jgi:hypothetical protein